ncbi:MAG: divalent metal cation transporter [Bacteroidetes bacterium]|nr:divalent metal cation transporter [Bacteroidota bacterium]
MSLKTRNIFKVLGPGIVVAATGIGAGDLVAAAVSGAQYGYALLWAAILGAVLKYVLNEGVSRWQLITGTSLLEGWTQKLNAFFRWYFILYLVIWSFIVAGALMAACGLSGHAILPTLSVVHWGIIHTIIAAIIVLTGKYRLIEGLMKFFIGLMFLVTISSAILIKPELSEVIKSIFIPHIPPHSIKFILGVIGGVGGSVTILSYGYWIRERKWEGKSFLKQSRLDLGVAYVLTALFGVAIMIVAAGVKPEIMQGNTMVLGLAEKMGEVTGPIGKWIFLIGFWGAVFSSMIGVWHGVPYIFADFMKQLGLIKTDANASLSTNKFYKFYLAYLAILPIILLFARKPVWIVIIYAIAGAFFMPFLAITLLYLNSRVKWLKEYRNSLITKILLVFSLLIFMYLLMIGISKYF